MKHSRGREPTSSTTRTRDETLTPDVQMSAAATATGGAGPPPPPSNIAMLSGAASSSNMFALGNTPFNYSSDMARIQSTDSFIGGGDRFGSTNSLHAMDRIGSLSSLTMLLEAHTSSANEVVNGGQSVATTAGWAPFAGGFSASAGTSPAVRMGGVSVRGNPIDPLQLGSSAHAGQPPLSQTSWGNTASAAVAAPSPQQQHPPPTPAYHAASNLPTTTSAGSLLLTNVMSASNLLALSESHRGASSARVDEFFHVPSSQSIWNNPAFSAMDLSINTGTAALSALGSDVDIAPAAIASYDTQWMTSAASSHPAPGSGTLLATTQTPRYQAMHGVPSLQSFALPSSRGSRSELLPSKSVLNLDGLQWNESMPDLITYLNSQLRKSESALLDPALAEGHTAHPAASELSEERRGGDGEKRKRQRRSKSDVATAQVSKQTSDGATSNLNAACASTAETVAAAGAWSTASAGSAEPATHERRKGAAGPPTAPAVPARFASSSAAVPTGEQPDRKKRRSRKRHQETINRLRRMLVSVHERANVVLQLSSVYLAEARYLAETQQRLQRENSYMLAMLQASGLNEKHKDGDAVDTAVPKIDGVLAKASREPPSGSAANMQSRT
ncbi:hypothetical protein FVE85_3087 [Porphyridium purpureum]|uniref:Uncharacterized protein n=1 Tax=Porphyridium purpureum TaxID=35688 RepID=A0A5J4YU11_PORPP|nr:hypothetical protein FVE85_3087 [Porphyridium purpureum]|eukprot:POR8394..scf227_4